MIRAHIRIANSPWMLILRGPSLRTPISTKTASSCELHEGINRGIPAALSRQDENLLVCSSERILKPSRPSGGRAASKQVHLYFLSPTQRRLEHTRRSCGAYERPERPTKLAIIGRNRNQEYYTTVTTVWSRFRWKWRLI